MVSLSVAVLLAAFGSLTPAGTLTLARCPEELATGAQRAGIVL